MPRIAYKYKAWDKFAKRIITRRELYFANPLTFNDIFDCQALGIVKDYKFAGYPLRITEERKLQFYKVNPIVFLNDYMRQKIAEHGICCFSKSYDSILMWSHYADYNRGVCFKFDVDIIESKISGLFENVTYVKKKPTYDFKNPEEDKSKWFFYKNRVWKYEKEVRGLIFPPNITKDEKYRKVKFPKDALKEIIFGANTDKHIYDEIICLCHKHGFSKVKFSFIKATTNSDSYKLQKMPYNRNLMAKK